MKLLTKEIEKKLQAHPFGSQSHLGNKAEVLVKFFNPYGSGTWLITEAEKQENGDWLMYGKGKITDWEWGFISFKELENVRVSVWGAKLPLERDMYAKGTVEQLARY